MATELRDPIDLYEHDFCAWAKSQAAALRAIRESRPNLPLDFERLIDEVEELASRDLRTAKSQLRRLILHLLKLEYSPAERPRRQWLNTIDDARHELEDLLSPSVSAVIAPSLERLFAEAKRTAARDLADASEIEAAKALPETCPYTLDQLLGEDWRPANRHGLVDDPF